MQNSYELLLAILILISITLGATITTKTKNYVNPINLFNLFFILPLALNRLKLSGIQSAEWQDDTYLLIYIAIFSFSIVPFFMISLYTSRFSSNRVLAINATRKEIKSSACILLATLATVAQLALNKLNSGFVFPFMHIGEITSKFHVIDVGFFGIALSVSWYVFTFYVLQRAVRTRETVLIIFGIIALISPITRLARFDIISLLFCVYIYALSEKENQKPLILKTFLAASILAILGAYIANYRWSAGGTFSVSFSELIQFNGSSGPFEVFSFLYAYYPLSFENIDRIIIKNQHDWPYAYGAFMLRPLLVGVLKLHHLFPGFPFYEHFDAMRDPLIGVATVPTAIPEFAVDFGVTASVIPMIFYSLIGCYLFINSQKNQKFTILYSFYSIAYFNLSFQNAFISPLFIYAASLTWLLTAKQVSIFLFEKNQKK